MKKYIMKTITLILTFAVLMSVVSTAVYATDEQSDDYYRITTAEQLNEIRNNLGGKYILCANINLSGQSWEPIGSLENPFTGTFDGNGYTISNVTINKHLTVDNVASSEMNIGFFGYTNGATIKNLGIENASYNVTTGDFSDTNFSNVGGIAGTLNNTNVECSYFKGSISNSTGSYVFARSGGIAAIGLNSSVTNCYSHSNIYANAVEMNTMAAGIVAWLDAVTIDKCYAAGSVVSENDAGYCYSGGMNASGNASSIFGIILSYGGTVKNSVVLLETLTANGTTNLYDNIGNFSEHSNNKVLSSDSSEAIQQSTYESLGWDFTNVWKIESSYPSLIKSPKTEQTKYVIHKREFDENIDYYTAECNSSVYNPTLANMLAALSAAAYDEDEITTAYQSLGFINDFSTHYYSIGNFDPNFCSYTIGFKDSEYNNEKVCLITVRGSDSFSDWVYNFDIFTAEEKHQGFFAPALVICQKIGEILNGNGILPNDVKYVITGHSRGAAVGNLLAVELMEQGINAENVYNYNYACPDVACKADFPNYDNIFNLCNTDDLVAFVPGAICNSLVTQGASWDKYGQTYWFTKDVDGFFASHAMDLYLEFFDRQLQLNVSDWPFEYESMASGVLTKVFCPVDVIITDGNGNSIASVINGEINYYDNDREIIIFTDGDKKIIYHNGDANFYVSLIGTDDGTMTFSIEKCNLATGEVTESKTFNDVVLEEGKTMYCSVDETTEIKNVPLFVVEEKNGEIIYTHTIGTDGTETVIPCEHTWNDGEITKQPTHTDFGETTFVCDDCGATKTEQIEKTTVHTYGDWEKINDTTHKHTCECGEYETENHMFGDWVITKEASESETGAKEKSCVCGYAVTEEIPKKVVETDPSNPSTDSNDSNESETSDTLEENNDTSIFDMLENIPKETIIIVGASIAGVILLVVICAIVKKKRS